MTNIMHGEPGQTRQSGAEDCPIGNQADPETLETVSRGVQPMQLSRGDRLGIAWALNWPVAVFSLAYYLLGEQLGLPKQLSSIDCVAALIQVFVICPWVVRRAIQLDYRGLRLSVVRDCTGEGTTAMKYRESLRVCWLITWRCLMIYLIVAATVRIVLPAGPGGPSDLFDELWSSVLSLLIFYFWIVGAVIKKNYAGFYLRFERVPPVR